MATPNNKSHKYPLPIEIITGTAVIRKPSAPRKLFEDNIYGKLFWDEIEWKAAQAECALSLLRHTWWLWAPLLLYHVCT